MSTKKEIEAALVSQGIPFDPKDKKDALSVRLTASKYRPEQMTRQELSKLTVILLKEILRIRGRPLEGLTTKNALIDALIQMNPEAAQKEASDKEQNLRKLQEIAPDAMREIVKRLSDTEKMKLGIAMKDRPMMEDARQMGHPTRLTVVSGETYLLQNHRPLAQFLPQHLHRNKHWTLENDALSVEFTCKYVDTEQEQIQIKIIPKINAVITITINLSRDLTVAQEQSLEKSPEKHFLYNISYTIRIVQPTSINTQRFINDMTLVCIGFLWIKNYMSYAFSETFAKRDSIPKIIVYDATGQLPPNEYGKYVKLFIIKLKKC